jgi:hypothetical protein
MLTLAPTKPRHGHGDGVWAHHNPKDAKVRGRVVVEHHCPVGRWGSRGDDDDRDGGCRRKSSNSCECCPLSPVLLDSAPLHRAVIADLYHATEPRERTLPWGFVSSRSASETQPAAHMRWTRLCWAGISRKWALTRRSALPSPPCRRDHTSPC